VRLKLDENITVFARAPIEAAGHDVDTVSDEHLAGRSDPEVFAVAAGAARVLVTFDVGFGDIRAYPPGSHPGIIVLRLRNQQPDNVVAALARLAQHHDLDGLSRCLIIVTEALVRIRWPD
jgi:predicted nuclease of predicted toxin-antitoxin system